MSFGFGFGFPKRLTSGGGLSPRLYLDFVGTGSLPSTVTFSRGTNATLTGSNGLIQYAPHNLLTNSEDFEAAAWPKVGSSVTANVTAAFDGTTTADKLVEDSTNGAHYLNRGGATAGIPQVFSVYAKSAGRTQVALQLGTNVAFFDLSAGTVVSGAGASIQAAGNGWYRCIFPGTPSNTNTQIYAAVSGSASYQGDGTSGVFLWGAQLELGSTVTAYNPTTPKNLLGFTQEPENAAWTKSNSYVQQNLLTWSQDFDNAAWTSGKTAGASVTANTTVAPDGTLTADTVTFAASSDFIIQQILSYSAVSGQAVTFSIYARTATQLIVFGGASPAGTDVFTATSVGSGWFRQVLTRTFTATVSGTLQLIPVGTNVGAGSFPIWGAQLVQGSTAGDYTQTTSAAAPTRYLNWDGTLTGRKLVETTAAGNHFIYQAFSQAAIPYRYSFYAKAGERSRLRLTDDSSTNVVFFDLSTGTVTNGTGTMTDAGGGWYRCSAPFSAVTTAMYISLVQTGTTFSYTGDGTSGIYVSDFQLSNSASVDPYVYNPQAAAASAAYYGPRFDYNPTTLASNGLLIEEQRTNLLTYSDQFDNVVWSRTGSVSITANSDTAPDGSITADRFVSTGGAFPQIAQAVTLAAGDYTLSMWVRSDGTSQIAQALILDGTAVSFTPTATWTRITVTKTGVLAGSRTAVVATNSGTAPASSFYIWGAQLEAGSFATSYIPTVASQVTRNADSASMLGDNFYTWYNPNQGTLGTEYIPVSLLSGSIAALNDGTFNNRTYLFLGSALAIPSLIVTAAGSVQANITNSAVTANTIAKTSGAYAPDNFAVATNAGTVAKDTSGTLPGGLLRLDIGGYLGGTLLNGWVRRISYYNTRLPDSTLQALTS